MLSRTARTAPLALGAAALALMLLIPFRPDVDSAVAARARQAAHDAMLRLSTAVLRERPAGYVPARGPCMVVWAQPSAGSAARTVASAGRELLDAAASALGLEAAAVDRLCAARGPVHVVLFPDVPDLAAAYGLPADRAPEGVYRQGVIGVVGPDAWGAGTRGMALFLRHGALTHEVAHWLVDARTRGNTPAWLSEGLAQLADWRATGYVWEAPVRGGPVPLSVLERRFDRIDQALAYREALALTLAIERAGGPGSLGALTEFLAQGVPFDAALERATGMKRSDLERVALRRSALAAGPSPPPGGTPAAGAN